MANPAAVAGADVVACDLTPELLETGRRPARDRGARPRRQEADAEAMPFDDAAFDIVLPRVGSCSPRATGRRRTNCCGSAGRTATPAVGPRTMSGTCSGTWSPT
ncbi:class I SAM-dependent methyltransferase [Streptomyces sp. HMX87]|uniref:class I SAM-dependent methyltransferase n=1 Tax=Streptomyces sp. HMX87 TaxID=3390849 RepID=UPI003A83D7D4